MRAAIMQKFQIFLVILTASLAIGSKPATTPTAAATRVARAIALAHQKLLDGHRLSAIKILQAAIVTAKKQAFTAQLQAEITRLSGVFLTNDGQRKFELAESERHSGGSEFLSKYEDALRLEPGNTRVMAGYILGLIAKNDCQKALAIAAKIRLIDPNMPELIYLTFRAQLCANPSALTEKNDADLDSDKALALYRKNVRAQEEYLRGNYEKAAGFARAAMKIDDKFPQSYYWAFKAAQPGGGGVDDAERFLYLCKGINAETRRRYNYEPLLCAQADEAEQFVQKTEAKKHEGT